MNEKLNYETERAQFESKFNSLGRGRAIHAIFEARAQAVRRRDVVVMPTLGTFDAEFVNREAQQITRIEQEREIYAHNAEVLSKIIAEFNLRDTRIDYSHTENGIQEWDD